MQFLCMILFCEWNFEILRSRKRNNEATTNDLNEI